MQYAYAHADLVSNSYGADEFSGETSFDSLYSGSPVPILFSSGDAGAVTEYPCTSILHHLCWWNQPAYHGGLVPHCRICLV